MDNFNIDENTMNNLKNMLQSGQLDDVVKQIPPDMFNNFSNMMNNNSNKSSKNASQGNSTTNNVSSSNNSTSNGFDFSKIDMNTMLKMKSIMEKMSSNDDPRANLLYSLKPYLRNERKDKIDQYANLLNMTKIAELLKNDNKENNKNE